MFYEGNIFLGNDILYKHLSHIKFMLGLSFFSFEVRKCSYEHTVSMEIFDEFDSSKKTPKLRTLLKLNTHLHYAENNNLYSFFLSLFVGGIQ